MKKLTTPYMVPSGETTWPQVLMENMEDFMQVGLVWEWENGPNLYGVYLELYKYDALRVVEEINDELLPSEAAENLAWFNSLPWDEADGNHLVFYLY